MSNPFHNALSQLARAQEVKSFPRELIDRLSVPEREVVAHLSLRMDDGTERLVKGYRVQHASLRGPYKGGIRFHPAADLDEVRALAFWMTMKTAVANIPLGGGKGGVVIDDAELSREELERLSRLWVRSFAPVIGPHADIPAPDVNTTPEIMDWMADEYAHITGDTTRATFTGKPLGAGGSEGRVVATALGGFYVFDALRAELNLGDHVTVAVQGMGNVGGNAARIFRDHGHTVVAISDSRGAIYRKEGIDIDAVEQYKKEHGTLASFPDVTHLSNEELLELPVDLLIPAALENQITSENADRVKASVVLELANGPTTPEADDMLFARKVTVIPDILANAGGVVVSYFEWQQNLANEHWSEEQIETQLKELLEREAASIMTIARENACDIRRAAFVLALERLETARTAR